MPSRHKGSLAVTRTLAPRPAKCVREWGDEDHRVDRRHELGVDGRVLPAAQRAGPGAIGRPPLRQVRAVFGRLRRDRARLQVAGLWDEAGEVLADAARSLQTAGAGLLLVCTNTMHKVADQVVAAIAIPLLHLADATASAVRTAGLRQVGLPGTAFTMEQDFYRDRVAGHGLEVLVPDADDRAVVHRVIYEELCLGIIREESRAAYGEVISRLVASGAEGIILGCTEIELLIRPEHSPVPVFATTRLHAEAAVDAAFASGR